MVFARSEVPAGGPSAEEEDGLLRLMQRRHSSRTAFDPRRAIARRALRKVLEAARWAPTAHNMQNYEVIVIDDPDLLRAVGGIRSEVSLTFIKENLEQLSFSEDELRRKKTGLLAQNFPPAWLTPDPNPFETADPEHSFLGNAIQSSPTLMIVVYDAARRAPASEGDVLGMMSLGCVLENMWLMADSLGISLQVVSAMSGDHVEEELRRILGFPKSMKVAFGVRLGYPLADAATLHVRRDVEDFTHVNGYAPWSG